MNNLNNPDWNISPDQGEGGGNSKWNYALLVPMLGLAAFRSIWSREIRKETVRLEMEIDMERRRAQGLEQALAFQRQQFLNEKQKAVLGQVEEKLMERQSIFCSYVVSRDKRRAIEKDLLVMAREPPLAQLGIDDGLRNIFRNDHKCAEIQNTNKHRNGSLMWVYLKFWKQQMEQQKTQAPLVATQPTEK